MSDYNERRKSRRNVTPITEDVIQRLAEAKIFDSNRDLNRRALELHKKLLHTAMKKNKSWEVGVYWNYLTDEYEFIKGTDSGISINNRAKILLNRSPDYSVVFMHNHPRNNIFSETDLNTFLSDDCIVAMTAVCNDGRIHILRKEDGCNEIAVKWFYNNSKQNNVSGVRSVINNAKRLGLKYWCSNVRK